MGTAVATASTAQRAFNMMLEKAKGSIEQHAINGVPVERIIAGAKLVTAMNPVLLQCSAQSVMIGVYQAARLGLEMGGPLGRAYLVPFKGQAQLIVGYKGLIELALRSGRITSLMARVVREGDEFAIVQGTTETILHKPVIPPKLDADGKPAPVVLVYAVAQLATGGWVFDWMPVHEIEVIRAGRDGPWATDWEQMARKTVIRRLSNVLPLTPELAAALELVNRELTGVDPTARTGAELVDAPEELSGVEAEVVEVE